MIYKNEYLKEISFPLGGIGTGSIGIAGNGSFIDWEIFNRPSKGSRYSYSHIGIKAKNKKGIVAKVLNGDPTESLMGQYGRGHWNGYGYGPANGTLCGFPHFKNVTFKGEFPIAELNFSDDDFPADVKLTAFNPFIPSDAKNSSIPAAFFEIEINNTNEEETEYTVEFTVANPNGKSKNILKKEKNNTMLFLTSGDRVKTDIDYRDMCIATNEENAFGQSYWYQGKWQDCLETFWNEFSSEADLKDRVYDDGKWMDCATLCIKTGLQGGEKKKIHFVLSWNTPNNYNYWSEYKDENGKDITWKNYYATIFEDSADSAVYALDNWSMLYEKTFKFKNALFSSDLDESVLDAVSANLAVLKSPTVLRLENGEFYGWEGVHETGGSCEGTCQHVWNYAYALCYLFPELERSIRDLEFKYSTLESGQMIFRLKLPLGRGEAEESRACVDGQMGAVIKTYREWKLSGDTEWLKSHWENVKKVLEYAWSDENKDLWDNNCDGVLEGRQHHTLDVELFGPSAWLQSMYMAALLAASKMADALGDVKKKEEYLGIFEKAKAWTNKNLFNGEHFIHKIDLKDKSILEKFDCVDFYWNNETNEIKYQIGEGSIIDQMLGEWHSNLIGIGEVFDPAQVKTALSSMMKLNFKGSMRKHANPWRVFSLNDEAGTVMYECDKKQSRPSIPIPYASETMTGFEYQFACLLIQNGMEEEGLRVVKAIRDRYDGRKRNPWNEIECGSNYARSMASFALLSTYSGFVADLPNNELRFNPVIKTVPFKAFFAVDGAWGMFKKEDNKTVIEILEGELELKALELPFIKNVKQILIDGKAVDFIHKGDKIIFENYKFTDKIEII